MEDNKKDFFDHLLDHNWVMFYWNVELTSAITIIHVVGNS